MLGGCPPVAFGLGTGTVTSCKLQMRGNFLVWWGVGGPLALAQPRPTLCSALTSPPWGRHVCPVCLLTPHS